MFSKICRNVYTVQKLHKVAAHTSNKELLEKIAEAIAMLTNDTFSVTNKKAGWKDKALTGMLYGAGGAVPVGAVGAYLIHQGGKETEDTTNKIIGSLLGAGTLAAGMYGAYRAGQKYPPKNNAMPMKRSSADDLEGIEDAVEKLATVMAIDTAYQDKTAAEDKEICACNRIYGMNLMYEIISGGK